MDPSKIMGSVRVLGGKSETLEMRTIMQISANPQEAMQIHANPHKFMQKIRANIPADACKHVQIRGDMYKYAQMHTNTSKYEQIHTNTSKRFDVRQSYESKQIH